MASRSACLLVGSAVLSIVAISLTAAERPVRERVEGNRVLLGCAPCRLYMDFEAFFCIVDVGDVVRVLQAYSETDECSTLSTSGMTPGAAVWDGGCPLGCTSHAECVGANGQEECAFGFCCDLCDISEVTQVLDMFADPLAQTPACPNPCPPGACQFDPAGVDAVCCRDVAFFDPDSASAQGTDVHDCLLLDDATFVAHQTCDQAFPGTPVCNSP